MSKYAAASDKLINSPVPIYTGHVMCHLKGELVWMKRDVVDSRGATTSILVHARCTRQSVPSAARNVKFLSSPSKAGLFTAGIAS